MAALSKREIQARLKQMRDWSHAGKAIQRKYIFKSFVPAISFINKIAETAERAGHHPDITVNYNAVLVSLSTHSEGGVTDKDFDLARQIDALAEGTS